MAPLQPGDMLGRYRLERPLGAGGMGSVWVAVQEGLGRRVALKVMHPTIATDPALAARFRQEAEVAASFNHPGIVPVTDFGVDEGRPYLVMDFLEGESLDAIVARDAPLPPSRVAFFAVQVLAALHAMHKRNIVHRDLKPDNIFVTASSGVPDIARLLDFGIARVVEGTGNAKMTTTGQVLGTPAYMSPEQAKGMPVTHASDLYALGVVMYEALTGKVPFEAENYHQLLFKIVEGTPTPLRELCGGVDQAFIAVVERAMNPKIELRFQDASEMRDALVPFAAIGELRPSQPRLNVAQERTPSGTDPFAATITPAPSSGTDPLAATMAPETPPESKDSRHDADAAAPAQSIHPPARSPWPGVFALIALLALGGGAYAALGGASNEESEPTEVLVAGEGVDRAPPTQAVPPPEAHGDEGGEEEGGEEEAGEEEAGEEERTLDEPRSGAPMNADMNAADRNAAAEMNAVDMHAAAANSVAMNAPDRNAAAMNAADRNATEMSSIAAPPAVDGRPDRIMAPCGNGTHENFLVGPNRTVAITSRTAGQVLRLQAFRPLLAAIEPALTRCYRGHYIRRGQDVHIHVDESGEVTSSMRVWCPIPTVVQNCVNRTVEAIDFAGAGASPGDASFGLDVRRR